MAAIDPNHIANAQAAPTTAVPIALDIGWTVAVLFGFLPAGLNQTAVRLPTEHELPEEKRIEVECVRLECLLTQLRALVPTNAHLIPPVPAIPRAPKDALRATLSKLNIDLLESLACASRELELAYQLGRSLRDTANPPVAGDRTNAAILESLTAQLARPRVSKLQEWLATLDPHLPADTAAIVGASIGRWSDFCTTVFDDSSPGRLRANNSKGDVAVGMSGDLLSQGDVWLNLLTGTESPAGLLTPEGYVAAGEAAISRTVRIVKRVVFHYWLALLLLALAVAAILAISAVYLGGAGKVWTQITAIAGALGATAKGIGSSLARISEEAERPIYRLEKLDAMAWSVTTLPKVRVDNRGVRALRRSGIQRSAPLGRA